MHFLLQSLLLPPSHHQPRRPLQEVRHGEGALNTQRFLLREAEQVREVAGQQHRSGCAGQLGYQRRPE